MEDDNALFERARRAAANAYSPYSGVCVGAALETGGGRIFEGCNVENASYGLTICAERGALSAMVNEGEREVRRVAVCVLGPEGATASPVPCGACLQCLAEFATDDALIITAPGECRPLLEFLPSPFRFTP